MQQRAETPLAIVGMACRLPGADDLEEFWQLLVDGRSDLGELPPDRFDRELYYDPRKGIRTKSYTTLGGVTRERPFDRDRCPLPEPLLRKSHKVHLQLCEVAAAACRHAGLNPFHLPQQEVGVYIGHTPPSALSGRVIYARMIEHTAQYLREVRGFDQFTGGKSEEIIREIVDSARDELSPNDPQITLCSNAYHAAALISEGFGLDGPAMSFDAACASSLRALGHAARALQSGQIEMAIVGGASYVHSDCLVLFSQAQSVSAHGSRPFDADADGLVAAEGYVGLCVKTLDKALADGDSIQAVIRGIGVSSDGRGKSLWAPRHEGQVAAIRRAYGSGLSPADLQFIEMHATSTQVGDATEINAFSSVLEGRIPAGRKIPIGSVKANVGHTLETAGLASLVKTVLSMQHGVVPPQINVNRLNPAIDWDQAPFEVPFAPMDWPAFNRESPRRAAVNAFGIGGLNVHVVLESPKPVGGGPWVPPVTTDRISTAEDDPSRNEPIAVIGMGAILPGARTIDALWDVLASGEDQKREVPPERWDRNIGYEPGTEDPWRVPTAVGGFITDFEYDWKKHKVPPKQIAHADPLQFMLLDAADQALKDAGYHEKAYDKTRTGVIVGTIFGGEFTDLLQMGLTLPNFQRTLAQILLRRGVPEDQIASIAEQYEEILLKHMPALLDETGSFTASTLASRITKTFDLMGGAVAVDAGDASAFAALSSCIDLLRAGDCEMMICAAGQRSMSFACYESLARTGQLARSPRPSAPFTVDADGCVPGDGVGVLLLKRLSEAQRDGDPIHAVIRGVGAARNDSLGQAVQTSARRSLQAAGLGPEQISVLEAGSVGRPADDQQEATGLLAVYGSEDRSEALRFGVVAAQFGNTGGAAGMTAFLKTVAELSHGEMPKNVGFNKLLPDLTARPELLQPAVREAPISTANKTGYPAAGVDALSQYDLAYHVVVEGRTKVPVVNAQKSDICGQRLDDRSQPTLNHEPKAGGVALADSAKGVVHEKPSPALRSGSATQTAGPGCWRIVRISDKSFSHLVDKASRLAQRPGEAFDDADAAPFTGNDRHRLAVVARDAEHLAQLCGLAAKQLEHPKARPLLAEKGVFYGELSERRPQVAFVFPGQGSQYEGMLKPLVDAYPPAARAQSQVDDVLGGLGLPSFAELAWEESQQLGTDISRTQLSLLAADSIVFSAVTALGLRPDRLSGHSFGELAALVAAKAWTFEDAVRATMARCAAIEGCVQASSGVSPGVMLSTNAPPEVIESLCSRIDGPVFVSHRNAPDQTVVGGSESAVSHLSKLAERDGYKVLRLDVPAAFHTPLMESVKEPFARGLQDIPLTPPMVPLLSSVTNRYVAEPADIRRNLVVQMTQPVRYVDLVERLAAEGPTVFIEVGPRSVLTGLHKRIFTQPSVPSPPPLVVSCDHPKRDAMQQLLFARACVEVSGAQDGREDRDLRMENRRPRSALHDPPSSEFDGLNVVRLRGTAYEMGCQHGRTFAEPIRTILRRYADLAGSPWDRLRNLNEAVSHPEVYFGPHELDELRGIADGAGVTPDSVIAHNLRLYLDAGAGGIHFAVTGPSNRNGGLLHAANEDLQLGLGVRDCLERIIQVRCPVDGLNCVTFGVAGQVGTLNGINAEGLAVSTTTLLDAPRLRTGGNGLLPTTIVKHIIEQCPDLPTAVGVIRDARSTVAFSLCISHPAFDQLCYVECDGSSMEVQWAPAVIAANHQRVKPSDREVPAHSRRRFERLKELLGGDPPETISISQAQAVLQDRFDPRRGRELDHPTLNTVQRVDNQISIVMQPGEGHVWVTPDSRHNGQHAPYRRLKLNDLFSGSPGLIGRCGTDEQHENAQQQTISQSGHRSIGEAEQSDDPVAQRSDCLHRASLIPRQSLTRAYSTAVEQNSNPESSPVCTRSVMRVVEQPLCDRCERSVTRPRVAGVRGPALIVGRNPAADALRDHLKAQGVAVTELPDSEDIDEVLTALDRIWESGPIPHLFLMTAHDEDAVTGLGERTWNDRRVRGVTLPFFITQRWYQLTSAAGLLEEASLVAATTMHGDFGFSHRVQNVESGALGGLLKGVRLEWEMGHKMPTGDTPRDRQTGFCVKVIDTPPSVQSAQLAEWICEELSAGDAEIEVGYVDGKRVAVRPVPEPVPEHDRMDIPRGAPLVITGGARGVTALVARELGRRFGVKLHLIGSSPVPDIPAAYRDLSPEELKELRGTLMKEALANGEKPAEAWSRFEKALEVDKTLRSLADEGLQATYHSCDVSNRAELAYVLDEIRAADGPIQGVIHGAGFERATRFEKKQRVLVERTIAAKVDGAAALMELTRNDPVRFFAAFGSVSGRFGGVGQADYCAANEMLAKLVDWYRQDRPACAATVFHWHAWDDVGMAVRPESQHIRKLHNIRFMPSKEGVEHLLRELQAGLPEGEIVITELDYCRKRYADNLELSGGASPRVPAEGRRLNGKAVDELPLIDAVTKYSSGERLVAELRLAPTADVFLKQHRYKGRPMMPVVVTMEALAEAASLLVGEERTVVGLRDIEIVNGLRFHSDDIQTARIHATRKDEGIQCEFTCDFFNRRGRLVMKDKPYLRAVVETADRPVEATQTMSGPPASPDVWDEVWYPESDDVIYHGPALRRLHDFVCGDAESWGRLVARAPEELSGHRRGSRWIIPAAVLDGCFFACGIDLWAKHKGVIAIPAGLEHIDVFRLPHLGEQCLVHIRDRGRDGQTALYDFTVYGKDGSVVLKTDGYRNVIVAEEPAHVG